MRIYTRKGDTGTTGLLFGGARVSKADLRTDAYGTTDEAVSALGLARAAIGAETDRIEADWPSSSCAFSASCSWSGRSWPPRPSRSGRG